MWNTIVKIFAFVLFAVGIIVAYKLFNPTDKTAQAFPDLLPCIYSMDSIQQFLVFAIIFGVSIALFIWSKNTK